jgi:transposase
VPAIAKVAFTSEDRVRDVIRNFNADGFDSLYPKYRGGHPPKFTLRQRREIKKIAKSKPAEHDLPFSTWSLAKLADFLVAEGVVDDISHEGLRVLLRAEGVTFQRLKTWKASKDPRYAAKKGADRAVVRDRRPGDHPGGRRPADRLLRGRIRADQPAAQARAALGRGQRQGQRARPGAAAPDAGHLHPHRRDPAPVRRLGAGRGQAVRAHQAA